MDNSEEKLSIYHLGEYYDRVYDNNQTTYYILPYVPEMNGMDVSVSLVPVTGETGLYLNVKTKPLELSKFDFKVEGKLSKRITVTWEE